MLRAEDHRTPVWYANGEVKITVMPGRGRVVTHPWIPAGQGQTGTLLVMIMYIVGVILPYDGYISVD